MDIIRKIRGSRIVWFRLEPYASVKIIEAIRKANINLRDLSVYEAVGLREAVEIAKERGIEPTLRNIMAIRWEEVQLSPIGITTGRKLEKELKKEG